MIIIITGMNVAEGKGPDFEKVALPAVEESAANTPCELFTLCKDRQNEGKYAAIGIYKDFEALLAQEKWSASETAKTGSSVAKFRAASPGLLTSHDQQVFEVID